VSRLLSGKKPPWVEPTKSSSFKNIFEILGDLPSDLINSIPSESQLYIPLSQGPFNPSINPVEIKEKLHVKNPTNSSNMAVATMSDNVEDDIEGEASDMVLEGIDLQRIIDTRK